MIYPVNPSDVATMWPLALFDLERAFALSEIDGAQDHLPLLIGDMEQLWCIQHQAWAITRVMPCKSGGRLLEIIAIGGRGLSRWGNEFFAAVEAWAKSHGCVKVIATGRPGWCKRAPGYSAKRITFVKEL